MSADDPKDGFDLLEYPCDFHFKAMCRVESESSQNAEQYIQAIVLTQVSSDALLGTRTKASRTGKFESVTATVRIENRDQLELIYQAIAASERVVMTL